MELELGQDFLTHGSPSLCHGMSADSSFHFLKSTLSKMLCVLLSKLAKKRTQITNVSKDVAKRKLSYTAGENANWCSNSGKQYGSFSKN